MSPTGYLVWFVVTAIAVTALLAVGMVFATRAYQRQQASSRTPKKPPNS